MSRRRWIADEVNGERAALVGAHAAHLARVLRARVGQKFDIATGKGVRRGTIANITEDRVEFVLGEELPAAAEAQVGLLLAIFKFDRMEWVIEKATELGVAQIIPVIARRTDAHLASAAPKRLERWRRIAREAAQQSRRVAPPEIAAPMKLREAVANTAASRIVLSEAEVQLSLKDALASAAGRAQAPASPISAGTAQEASGNANVDENETRDGTQGHLLLAVGPEGGWTADELKLFSAHGWISASLGSTILRAETAAIVALAIAFSEVV